MSYPRSIRRLVVSGFGDGDERWSWSLHLADYPAPTPGNGGGPFGVSDALVTAISNWHKASASSRAWIDSIKLNDLDTEGRYLRQSTIERVLSGANAIPGTGTSAYPAQVALAITLRTNANRGLASKGRFYVAYPKQFSLDQGVLQPADQTTLTTAARTFINTLNTLAIGTVIVASKVGTGVLSPVTGVSVGRRYDIIRSRGASLEESPVIQNLS